MFLIFPLSEAGHVLQMFLFSEKFEPQCSYKHSSYKKKRVIALIGIIVEIMEDKGPIRGSDSV